MEVSALLESSDSINRMFYATVNTHWVINNVLLQNFITRMLPTLFLI